MLKSLEGVTVEYTKTIPTSKQAPEFYVWQQGAESYATITYLDRVVEVERNGDMKFHIPELFEEGLVYKDKTIRYSDDLEAAGIVDDIQLNQFIKTMGNSGYDVNDESPWWELFSHNEDMGEIYDTFYEAIDAGLDYITDDANWG